MYCATHPAIDAVRECARCGALHCVDCVRWVGNERKQLAACTRCDGVLRPLNVRIVATASAEATQSLERLFTPTALLSAAAVGVLTAIADIPVPLVDLILGLVAQLALAGTYFNVVDHVGTGKAGFPAPVEAEGWEFSTLVVRGMLCLLVVCTPFGIWLGISGWTEDLGLLVSRHWLTAALLAAFTLAWLTAALLAMLLTVSGLAAFWPAALVRVVVLDPARYAQLLGIMAASSLAIALVRWTLSHAPHLPFLSTWFVATITALALFAQAALVGGFVHRHREIYTTR